MSQPIPRKPQPTVYLWQIPPDDFERWQAFDDTAKQCLDYAEYLAMLADAQVEFAAKGHHVVRVRMSVDEMRRGLAQRQLPNIPAARGFVLQAAAGLH